MHFLGIPIRSLIRHPVRSALAMLGIAVATGSFFALTGLTRSVADGWSSSLQEFGAHLVAYRKGTMNVLSGSLDENQSSAIRQVTGVADVSGELVDLITLSSGEAVLIRGWSADSSLWRYIEIMQGSIGPATMASGVILGETLADALQKNPGDTIELFGDYRLDVLAIAKMPGVMNNYSMITSLNVLQELMGRPGTVTVFNIEAADITRPEVIVELKERLSLQFPQLLFAEADRVADQSDLFQLFEGLAWGTSTVALTSGLVIVLITMLTSVTERTREIGVLLAVGWSNGRIFALVVSEGLMLTALACIPGLLLGLLGLYFLSYLPQLQGFLVTDLPAEAVMEYVTAVLVLGVLGSSYPAWRAMRKNPVEALRYE